jgi:pyruvate dehydrogenase E2 component (dihydrolipoamide acetyltransferase)
MASLLRMPEVAANAVEAVLQEWLVEENASFSAAAALATIETDKAVVDIESETDGVLLKRLVPNGTKVEVGAPIALIGEPAEQVGDLDEAMSRLGVTASGAEVSPDRDPGVQLSGGEDGVPQPEEPAAVTDKPSTVPEANGGTPADDTADGSPAVPRGTRIFSSPLARRLAGEAGLDVATLQGTGPRGRILRRDVEAALAATPAPTASPTETPTGPTPSALPPPAAATALQQGAATDAGFTDVPHTRMRRAIAARLGLSKQTVPHFYVRATLDVDELLRLRARLNDGSPVKISVNDLVVKAAAAAHLLVPEMNAVWTEDAVRRYERVDIAVAVATDGGLLTPVVRGVDTLTVSALAARTRDVAERAKSGRLRQDELEGGTLSVTNLGMVGTEEFAAIINPPQAAILAVGAARQEPVVRDGALAVGTVMRVTLSVDHRPVDGVVAARWMQAFTDLVQNPVRILA